MKLVLKSILLIIVLCSCSEKRLNDSELYLNAEQYRTYNSHTGKPFTGIGVNNNGPYAYNRTIEVKYKDGYSIEITYKDSQGKTRAIFKTDERSNPTGELYYDKEGNIITKSEFEKTRE